MNTTTKRFARSTRDAFRDAEYAASIERFDRSALRGDLCIYAICLCACAALAFGLFK